MKLATQMMLMFANEQEEQMVVPFFFYAEPPIAGASDELMEPVGGLSDSGFAGVYPGFSGTIIGFSVYVNSNAAGSTLRVNPHVDFTVDGTNSATVAIGTRLAAKTFDTMALPFAANVRIGVAYTTAGGWTSSGRRALVVLYTRPD